MEKLQYECEQYKLHAPDSLKYITDYMPEILIPKIEEYKELFDIKNANQVQINYFDRLENFRNFVYELRGERESLPEYSRGVGDEGMISAFIPKNAIVGTPLYQSSLYMANHELFHIWYNQYILKGDESKRIVWYDEGMAKFLSGENNRLLEKQAFVDFYETVKASTKCIPDLNELDHGSSFCTESYDAYDLSYLAIRYLHEVLSEEEFKLLVSDFERIKFYGQSVLKEMFDYYDQKIEKRGMKK